MDAETKLEDMNAADATEAPERARKRVKLSQGLRSVPCCCCKNVESDQASVCKECPPDMHRFASCASAVGL